ncbi:beta strand repeat-containing protein [Nostoc sp.]|uniref:beta strand repeat-containing protein n=1 Tax=Nostoc sp. TaxID=1180 RepID=UPI002FF4BD69
MKNLWQNFNIFGWGLIGATLVLQPTSAQAQYIQRSFLNPSFESPVFGSAGQKCYVQVSPGIIPGWETTHGSVANGTGNCTGYTSPGKVPLIEIWTTGFSSVSTATNAGNQFAELNAEQASELYQNICLIKNETITFSLLHRGRSSATVADVANFLIGLNTDPTPIVFGKFSTTSNGTVTAQPVAQNGATIPNVTNNNAANGWVRYTGTVPYTGASGNQPVGFAAVSTAGGNNTVGNFLDDVQFAGKPVLEFTASSGGAAESETNPTTNPPKLRIVGLVPTGGISVPISVSGTAALGADYNTTSGTSTFNITIPAGNYDGSDATSVFTIPFTVINNNIPQGARTIVFTIQSSTSFFASSTTTCGASPIIASNYTIYDDDFLSGKVWDDADNSANNTFTNINTGSETGTNAGGLLNAILVDSNNKVLKTTSVATDGTYTFLDVPLNQSNVKIILSTTAGTVGNTAPTSSLPANWVNTSPLTTATFNIGTSISNKDFGIEQFPDTNNVNAALQPNPGGTNQVQVAAISGTDPEDGTLGSGKNFKIVTLPTNGTLYYNGTAVTAGQVITNYDPTKLTIDPNDGIIIVSFTYAAIDAAGKEDPTPATVTIPFSAALVSISGTLYRDNDHSGTNNGEPGIGSIRVILYKDTDNNDELTTSEIIQQVTTLADGTYQFTNVAPGTYKIKVDIADTHVPLGYTLGTTDNLPVTVNTTNITGQDFGFYPALTCEWDAQLYTGHFPVAGQGGNDSVANGYYGPTGLPTLRGTAKFGTGIAKFTFNDQTINVSPPVHPLRTIINGSFPSQGYVPINGDYPLRTYGSSGDEPNWVIVFKRQAIAKGRVTLGQTGAYIDDAMEIYINGVRVGNPVLTYTTSLAANQVSTVSVNAGDIVEVRLTNFGYIGGFVVTADFVSDFGDAPNSYGEVSHAPSCSNPHLGATVTGEYSQSYSANADGDAGDDGVTLPSSLTPGTTATITVNASTAGFLNSWIDFNKNGVFDSGEQLSLTNVTKGTAATVNNVPLNAGNNTLTFTVPSNATVGSSFARFRFTTSTVATPSPTGSGDAGEVEDYPVTIATIPNVLLVKRITAINADHTKNPNDNTPLNVFVDDTTSTRKADDNSPNWKPNYLLGAIDAGKVKPGDEIEYTIYFLNAGSTNANSVRVCDRISANQNFKASAYGISKDIQLQLGTSTVLDLTSASDTNDRAQLISAGGSVPANCYLKAANDNGTLVIDVTGNTGVPNLTTMPGSTGQGSPNDSYGFLRFITKVKP